MLCLDSGGKVKREAAVSLEMFKQCHRQMRVSSDFQG